MNRSGWLIIVAILVGGAMMSGCAKKKKPDKQVESSPQGEEVREAAVTGIFYPDKKDELTAMIDGFLAKVDSPPVENVRGLVCPHAGYRFSGQTAAYAYKQLVGRDVRTVVIMAPSHYALFRGASIPHVARYRTPLGTVDLSPKAKRLGKIRPFVINPPCEVDRPTWWRISPKKPPPPENDTPHTWEHSLEVQIPFLQRTLKNFTIIPIVFAPRDFVDPEEVAQVLMQHIDDATVLVASSDLSHYHPDQVARRKDDSCVKAICDLDTERMKTQEACGKSPILTLMYIAKRKGWKAKSLDYRNSADATGDKSAVVGYAAIVLFEPEESAEENKQSAPPGAAREEPTPGPFSSEERKFLLNLARKTIEEVVTNGTMPEIDATGLSSKVTQPKGCFVTLKKNGQLRGCIGHIFPREPLYRAVMDNARNAATKDIRFSTVEPEELEEIEIEISVLTVPQPLSFESPDDLLNKLRPEVDGVVLTIGRRQATFLPQVWEQLPDKETFLAHLTAKAGLPPSAWKTPGTSVLTYQAEAFEESEM